MTCASCGGSAHPATGHAWSAKTLICGPCARSWLKWWVSHTSDRPRKKRGKETPSFYGAALKKNGDDNGTV
jgi:hypothetical protein